MRHLVARFLYNLGWFFMKHGVRSYLKSNWWAPVDARTVTCDLVAEELNEECPLVPKT